MAKSLSRVRSLVVIAVFSAASAGLGLVKLPAPMVSSIALDSLPGFFCAGFFAPWIGGVVGGLGHLASAATGRFPLGPVHLIIALQMFCWCFLFGYIARKFDRPWALVPASLVAIFLNAVASPIMLAVLFPAQREIFMGLIGFLLIAASANILLAAILVKILSKLEIPGM